MIVSIIIPIFNVELYISECIQSVMDQTITEGVECILVDDCGQDRSVAIAKEMISNYHGPISFSILHHDHNMGLSSARNSGINVAKGKYIYFLDSDDKISPDCIETLYAPINEDNSLDMVMGNFQKIGNESTTGYIAKTCKITKNIIDYMYENEICIGAWNKLVSKDLIIQFDVMFQEGLLSEDILWTRELALVLSNLYTIDKCTYFYRIRCGSITHSDELKEKLVHAYFERKIRLLRYIFKHNLQNEIHTYYFVNKNLAELITKNNVLFNKPDMHDTFYNEYRKSPFWTFMEQRRIGVKPFYLLLSLNRYFPKAIGRYFVVALYHIDVFRIKLKNILHISK